VASVVFVLMAFTPQSTDASHKKLRQLKKLAALALLSKSKKKILIPLPLPLPLPIPIITSKQSVIVKESHIPYSEPYHGNSYGGDGGYW